ncbi:MAG TPA: hypothetical protein VIN58_20240 [Roseateles sp.]
MTLFDEAERRAIELVPSQWLDELRGERVSINYGSERPMQEGLNFLGRAALAEVEALLVFDERNVLTFAASSLARVGRGVFEIARLAADPLAEFMTGTRLNDLAAHGRLHYGYCRHLGLDMSPLSESEVRKSLLGTTTARVDAARRSWLSGHDDVKAGAVRGLYPVNYWSAGALAEMKSFGIAWPEVVQVGVGLNRIDVAAKELIESMNPGIRRFIRFGST